jgi:hypothetical protein
VAAEHRPPEVEVTEPRRERCSKCDVVHDVDVKGRLVEHRRAISWVFGGGRARQVADTMHCDGSRVPSKEESARRAADRKHEQHRKIHEDRGDILVALDCYLEGRSEFAERLDGWRALALFAYREKWNQPVAHPYRYVTRVAASSRRAETRGDIHCRYCGDRLVAGVKQPHVLVKESADMQRHLTICALHVLAGMRESVAPDHKALPMEPLFVPVEDGPLFGAKG